MIKLIRAKHQHDYVIELEFSDGSTGDYDVAPLIARDTELTRPLKDLEQFTRFFIDLGALCWPGGLELNPEAIQRRLREAGALRKTTRVA